MCQGVMHMFEFIGKLTERLLHRSAAEADVMLKRLHQIEQENLVRELRHFDIAEEQDESKDNFLRKDHIDDGQFRHSADAAHLALQYWRHGTSGSCRYDRAEDFEEMMHPSNPFRARLGRDPTAAGAVTAYPAFGWESTCFGSFLKEAEEKGH